MYFIKLPPSPNTPAVVSSTFAGMTEGGVVLMKYAEQ